MIALAVVGPIASGKSFVLQRLAELGAEVSCADRLAAELTAPGQPALARIFAAFGDDYRQPDGSLDRRRLAGLIFRETEARERLEAILHPVILERIRAWLGSLRSRPRPPAVAAVEVLRLPEELGAREPFDLVWLCLAPAEVRLRRLMARDGLTEAEARSRIAVQDAQRIGDCRPDLDLDTSGTEGEVRERVGQAWKRLPATSGSAL